MGGPILACVRAKSHAAGREQRLLAIAVAQAAMQTGSPSVAIEILRSVDLSAGADDLGVLGVAVTARVVHRRSRGADSGAAENFSAS